MRKSLITLGAVIIIFIGIIIPFYGLTAFMPLKTSDNNIQNVNKQKRSTNFKINEEDFINTMFLRSSFFENGSDTNYFVNPTLKTSKSLTYNENGYLDFLKDSYATGIVFDKPSDRFLELYKNGDNYVKQYNLDRFYNVDEKFFLKDLTNFIYSFINEYNLIQMLSKLKINININNLEQIDLNKSNGKLIDDVGEEVKLSSNKKGYIGISYRYREPNDDKYGVIEKFDNIKKIKVNYGSKVYRGDGNNEPTIPTINSSTGEITNGNEKIES